MKKSIILITLFSAGICHAKPEITNSQFLDFNISEENERAVFGGPSPISSGFNYQGELVDAGVPANGNYDFSFQLYDALSNGNQIGVNEIKGNRFVTNGLFNIEDIDFGDASYDGDERWLSVTVRETGNANSETTLTPRQKIHAVPYAVQAEFGAGGDSPWTESGSNASYDGTVGIGGTTISNVDLFIDSDTGRSPLLARVNSIPKLAVNTNGGTTLGFLLEQPPEDGLLVKGSAAIGRISTDFTDGTAANKGMFTIGADVSLLTFDGDDIQRIVNGVPSTLFLNWYGGNITMARTGTRTMVRGELTVNEDINAGAKITASDSGDADMKAYIYGRVNGTGSIATAQSSAGFSLTKVATGHYTVNFDDSTINTNYMASATTNSSSPKFASVVIGTDSFDVHVWNTSGNHTDHSFTFVVYRK